MSFALTSSLLKLPNELASFNVNKGTFNNIITDAEKGFVFVFSRRLSFEPNGTNGCYMLVQHCGCRHYFGLAYKKLNNAHRMLDMFKQAFQTFGNLGRACGTRGLRM